MENEVVTVPFHGDTIFAVREGGHVLVAVKPIVERLGIAWHGQLERIKRDVALSEGIRVIRIPSLRGGEQDTICLPISLIHGFLFGIEERRIQDEVRREAVIRYKRECYAVLHEHFFGPAESEDEIDDDELADAPLPRFAMEEWPLWLQVIQETRRVAGPAAAREVWAQSSLPQFSMIEADGVVVENSRLPSNNPKETRDYWRTQGLGEEEVTRKVNSERQRRWRAAMTGAGRSARWRARHPEWTEQRRLKRSGMH